MKSVLWRVAKCLFYIEEVRCPKVNVYSSDVCMVIYTFTNLNQMPVIKRN